MPMAVRIYFKYPTRLLNIRNRLQNFMSEAWQLLILISTAHIQGQEFARLVASFWEGGYTVLTRTAPLSTDSPQKESSCSRLPRTFPIFCKPRIRTYIRALILHISLCLKWIYISEVWESGIWEQFPSFFFFNQVTLNKNILYLFFQKVFGTVWRTFKN